uniref:Uncharacterized protein n=1 Tax=uncultured prokaryote TaxID=198431 RepID=A0A0H5QPS9_9ZZZZ|nr:hypothetical protein [uncultured prokaryote]
MAGHGRTRNDASMIPDEKAIETIKNRKGAILRLGRYLFGHWPLLSLALVMNIVSNSLALVGPMLSGYAIDAIQPGRGQVDFSRMFRYAAWMAPFIQSAFFRDKFCCPCISEGLFCLIMGEVSSHINIFKDGILKDYIILEYHTEVHHGPYNTPIVFRPVISLHGLPVFLPEPLDGARFLTVGFERFLSRNHLLGKSVEAPKTCRPFPEEGLCPGSDETGDKTGEGNRKKEYQHQPLRNSYHHGEGTGHSDDGSQNLYQIRGQGFIDRINIIKDAADDITGLMGIIIPYRKRQHLIKDIFPHPISHFSADDDHQYGENVGQHG